MCILCLEPGLENTVGWRDVAIFAILKMGTVLPIIFYESKKNQRIWPGAA